MIDKGNFKRLYTPFEKTQLTELIRLRKQVEKLEASNKELLKTIKNMLYGDTHD